MTGPTGSVGTGPTGAIGVITGPTGVKVTNQIGSAVLVASTGSISFTSIPQTYSNLQLVADTIGTNSGIGASYFNIQFNSDNSSSYSVQGVFGVGSSVQGVMVAGTNASQAHCGVSPSASDTAGAQSTTTCLVVNYTSSTVPQSWVSSSGYSCATSSWSGTLCGSWNTTNAAITRLDFTPVSGSFAAGSAFYLYGLY